MKGGSHSLKGGCLDCGLPVSKPWVRRCRPCNGRRMRERHRQMRALRAGVLSVQAKAARRLVKKMDGVGGVGGGGSDLPRLACSGTGAGMAKSRNHSAPPLELKECAR